MITNNFTAEFELGSPTDGSNSSAEARGEQLVREAFNTHNWGLSSHLNSINSSRVTDDSGDEWTVEVDFTVRFDGSPSDIQSEFENDVSVCKNVTEN